MKRLYRNKRFLPSLFSKLFLLLLGILMALAAHLFVQDSHEVLRPVLAQTLRIEDAASQIYEQMPDLPQENQYVRVEIEAVDDSYTLINRFIRYHLNVKRRSPFSRLDWKLTLADYLDANESIKPERYPGYQSLATNPMEGDLVAIATLNRRQRAELVDRLVLLYRPNPPQPSNTNNTSTPTATPKPTNRPNQPRLSKPGDAELLMP